MAEEWQLEAVREQFKVLNSLENIQKDLKTNDICVVIKEVDIIVKKHLRVKEKNNLQPIGCISDEIIKASNGNVKFGFIVIVTEQRVNGLLSKIPIFVIQCGKENVFIDMSCFSFKSWDSFLQRHCRKILPPGKFCFPVNGYYLDGRRLKIDFATNQTVSIREQSVCWKILGMGLTIASFTASFFFNIKPTVLGTVANLIPTADKYLDSFNTPLARDHLELIGYFLSWKNGDMQWWEVAPLIFKSLCKLHNHYKKEIDSMTEYIKDKFRMILNYLNNKFSFVFKQTSLPLRLLAYTNNNDELLVRNGNMNDLRQNNVGASQIFENCIAESSFCQMGKEKYQDEPLDLNPCNKALVCMTSDFVQHRTDQQNLLQNEVSNTYLILQTLVVDESKERLKLYYKSRDAAQNSGCGINIDEYNQRLGITEDPETHCFMEAIRHIKQSPIIQYLVKSKCKELVEQEPVQLIQCLEMPHNNKLGLYKCIGMENGLIPAKKFVKPLKEIFCTDEDNEFDEDKLVVKEEGLRSEQSSQIVFHTNKICVFIQQDLTCEGNAEGFLEIIEDE